MYSPPSNTTLDVPCGFHIISSTGCCLICGNPINIFVKAVLKLKLSLVDWYNPLTLFLIVLHRLTSPVNNLFFGFLKLDISLFFHTHKDYWTCLPLQLNILLVHGRSIELGTREFNVIIQFNSIIDALPSVKACRSIQPHPSP